MNIAGANAAGPQYNVVSYSSDIDPSLQPGKVYTSGASSLELYDTDRDGKVDIGTLRLQGKEEIPTSVMVDMKDRTVTIFSPVSGDSDVPTVFKIDDNGNFVKQSGPLNAAPIGDGVTSIDLGDGNSVNLFPSYQGGPIRVSVGNNSNGAQLATRRDDGSLGGKLY